MGVTVGRKDVTFLVFSLHILRVRRYVLKGPVTGAGQVYSGRSSYAEYSSIQQAIYGQAVKPTGRFNDRT
jgi:hypothetical protein